MMDSRKGDDAVLNDRIAIYLPSLRGGGAERVMVTLANGFAARGFAVDLVLAKAEGPYLKDVASTVRVVDLDSPRTLLSLPGLVRYLRRERPVSMLSALNHANVVAVAAKQLARVPMRLVVSERNTLSVSNRGSRALRVRLLPWLMRGAYRRADGVVTVSAGVADDLVAALDLPRKHVRVIYNPMVTDTLLAQSKLPLSHSWLAPDQPPLVLAVGRLTPQKDFRTLIHGFARLRQARPVRLVILGDGEQRGELEAIVGELGLSQDVALPGFVDNPFAWMRQASLFVLSSAWEGLPGVLIQAMACGAPVVSTDCPSGPAEILENGRWGRLVPVGDAEALAVAMAATLDEREHPDVAARAMDFGVEQAVDAYLAALRTSP
jgi:glycosyltransferase involved in cell wall biosynthesis